MQVLTCLIFEPWSVSSTSLGVPKKQCFQINLKKKCLEVTEYFSGRESKHTYSFVHYEKIILL